MVAEAILRIGIIGVGNIGSAHMKALLAGEIPKACLTAVCDVDPQKLEQCKERTPALPCFTDHRKLLDSGLCDAVIIATPHYFHPPIAIDAFAAGLHVLTEKPAGVDRLSVEKMNEAAKSSGCVFGIMFNQRTNRLFAQAKQIVSSGDLGDLKRVVWIITNWYRKQAYYDSGSWRGTWNGEGGGVLINQAPHQLDLWQWICGMPKSIRAICHIGQHHSISVEDDATILAEYENGATGVFITSTGDYPGTNRLEITGTKGSLVLEQGKLTHRMLAMDERDYCSNPTDVKNKVTEQVLEDERINGHVEILKNFTSAILHHTPLLAPGYEGINELTLSNAAYLSAWTNCEVMLPMDDAHFQQELQKRRDSEKAVTENGTQAPQGNYLKRWNVIW